MNLLEQFVHTAAEQELWRDGDVIVAAVSGGPDSMALLHMLASIADGRRLTTIAAHVNHGFRQAESARELEVVKQYADHLGVRCETVELDLPSYIAETGLNSQAAARELRYKFLLEAASRNGASRIALAHHADDQAETVLMHVIRGTGLTGLAGMRSKRIEKNVELIRPLLRMNKSDLITYCSEHSVPYCVDSSNLERHYFRNIVRLDILPYMSQYNPQLSLSLQRLADVAGEEDDWMEAQTEELFRQLVAVKPGECSLSCLELNNLHVALQRRLIKLILNYLSLKSANISFEAIETMRLAASNHSPATWRMDAGSQIQCAREYEWMRWRRLERIETDDSVDFKYEIHKETQLIEVGPAESDWSFQLEHHADSSRRPASRYEACFDAGQLTYPLMLRNRRFGDRIQVLGLNGSKKVQDMFVDEKIAPSIRERYPLLVDASGRLLWIPGIRRSNHALVGKETEEVLYIRAFHE